MLTLYDSRGNKIERGKLKAEESAPSLQSIRQVYSTYPSRGLTPTTLASHLRRADEGEPYAQCELFEEMEEKDPHLLSVLSTRRMAVSGLEINVTAPDGANAREKKAADLVRDHLSAINDMPDAINDMLDAIGKGYSATEIIWGIHQQEAVIQELKWRQPKWFRFDLDTMSKLLLITENTPLGSPLTPYKYVTHFHKAKSGIPARGGILRPCAWMYLFKNYTLKDWVVFAEVYGQPFRVGKYPTSASEKEKDVLLNAVANMGSDAAAIVPDSMLVEIVDAGRGTQASAILYENLVRLCDEQMSKAIIGQTLSSDAQSTGMGSGVADLQGGVRHDIKVSDARQISSTLSRDIGRPLVDLNMGPVDRYPIISIMVDDADDLTALAGNVKTLVEVGLPVPEAWAYKKFNIPAPQHGEAVLQPPSLQPPALNQSMPSVSTAANTAPLAGQSDTPADLIASRVQEQAQTEISAWISTIEVMLDHADSMEHFRAMLLAAWPTLPTDRLSSILTQAEMSAQAAGRYDIEQTSG